MNKAKAENLVYVALDAAKEEALDMVVATLYTDPRIETLDIGEAVDRATAIICGGVQIVDSVYTIPGWLMDELTTALTIGAWREVYEDLVLIEDGVKGE